MTPPVPHTPDPWLIAKSGVSVDAGRIRIRQENAGSLEERQANARVIAAAPTLLFLLRQAVEHVEGGGTCTDTYSDGSVCRWLRDARELLTHFGPV